nr:PREDICTED: uncharacterized protein LOC109044204 [Bemisia tabaci]
MYKTVLFSFLCATGLGQLVDRTLEPRANGRDVVETVINRIRRSRLFQDDKEFLRRLAYAETNFGEDPKTYRDAAVNGGIWKCVQLNLTQYNTSNLDLTTRLLGIHEGIKRTMGIDWIKVEDGLTPLYSGLSASILIDVTRTYKSPLPGSIDDQDSWLVNSFSLHKRTEGGFARRARELLEEDLRSTGGRIDVMLVLDGSSTVGEESFSAALDSLARLVNIFDLEEANVGMVTFSDSVTELIPLMNDLTMPALQRAIRLTRYPKGRTKIYVGMMAAIDEFKTSPASRKESGVPRLMVVLTDGTDGSGPDPALAAKKAAKAGIVTCAFGIGSKIDDNELLSIANNETDNVLKTHSYATLKEHIALVARLAKSMPQTPKLGSLTRDTMKKAGERRYYRFAVSPTGATVILDDEWGQTRGYWTFAAERPSSAFHDGVLTEGETYIEPPRLQENRSDTGGGGGRVVLWWDVN